MYELIGIFIACFLVLTVLDRFNPVFVSAALAVYVYRNEIAEWVWRG